MTDQELQVLWSCMDDEEPNKALYRSISGARALKDLEMPDLSVFDPPEPEEANESANGDTAAI